MSNVVSISEYKNKKLKRGFDEEQKLEEDLYEEFIGLLRFFVSETEPKYNLIHVHASKTELHIMKDSKGNIIENEELDDAIDKPNANDLLFNSLLEFNPRKIVIHNSNDMDLIFRGTLREIFGNAVRFE